MGGGCVVIGANERRGRGAANEAQLVPVLAPCNRCRVPHTADLLAHAATVSCLRLPAACPHWSPFAVSHVMLLGTRHPGRRMCHDARTHGRGGQPVVSTVIGKGRGATEQGGRSLVPCVMARPCGAGCGRASSTALRNDGRVHGHDKGAMTRAWRVRGCRV